MKRVQQDALPGVSTAKKVSKIEIIDLTVDDFTTPVWIYKNGQDRWNETQARSKDIVVIADGAGTAKNRVVYDALREEGYKLKIIESGSQEISFTYPKNWTTGRFRDDGHDLAGFGHVVGHYCVKNPPALIICGSRGSQVTLAVVMRYYWRGPFIAMNGGPLTSNTPMNVMCSPCFLTFSHDYFATNDIEFSMQKYNELSESKHQTAFLVHVQNEGHMPKAKILFAILQQLIPLMIHNGGRLEVQKNMWPDSVSIFQLRKDDNALKFWG